VPRREIRQIEVALCVGSRGLVKGGILAAVFRRYQHHCLIGFRFLIGADDGSFDVAAYGVHQDFDRNGPFGSNYDAVVVNTCAALANIDEIGGGR